MAAHNRRIRARLLLVGVAILVALGFAGAWVKPPMEPDQVVEARFGDVSWNHELHARLKDIANCQVCHHKERQGTTKPKPCRHCHKEQTNADALVVADLHQDLPEPKYEGENGPPPMTAFHGKCVGCHKAMAQGPVGCRDCHAQTVSGAHGKVRWDHQAHARRIDMDPVGNCQRCHHQDEDAKTDADYRPCDKCHAPAATMDLKLATGLKLHEKHLHFDCQRCHQTADPEESRRTCKDCHKGWQVDTEKKERPPIEQAAHARCLECHRRDNPDLKPGMPARCIDCHKPDPSTLAGLGVGLVLWDHDRHARYGEAMRCDRCHHTDAPDQPHMACARCHGTGLYENPSVADVLQKRCLGCHKEEENGLISWQHISTERKDLHLYRYDAPEGTLWWNHREHAVDWSFSCRNCHHGTQKAGGKWVMGEKTNKEWKGTATHVQKCDACHGPDGPVAGSPAEGTKAPPLHESMKKICVECHRRLGAGPQDWPDFFKIEPIERATDADASGSGPDATEGGER